MSTCYILLQNGGRIIKQSGDGFLLLTNCVVTPEDTVLGGDFSHLDTWLERQNEKYRGAKREKERKEQEIIEQKLAVQALLNEKRDLEKQKLKQNEKQITALQREIESANNILKLLNEQLAKYEADLLIQHNLLAEILLMDSDPFYRLEATISYQ